MPQQGPVGARQHALVLGETHGTKDSSRLDFVTGENDPPGVGPGGMLAKLDADDVMNQPFAQQKRRVSFAPQVKSKRPEFLRVELAELGHAQTAYGNRQHGHGIDALRIGEVDLLVEYNGFHTQRPEVDRIGCAKLTGRLIPGAVRLQDRPGLQNHSL